MTSSYPISEPRLSAIRRLSLRRRGDTRYLIVAGAIAVCVIMPLVALVWIALSGTSNNWGHLVGTILPEAIRVTVLLMAGVAVVTAAVGVGAAWLVTNFDFPGRAFFGWALVLPLAVPTYIAAFSIVEFLHFTGPVQSTLRALFGFSTPRDYWFPDIRSLAGAVLILSSVLYPYVFLTVRASFLMQGRRAADVARTLGHSPLSVARRIQLPLARPAVAIGVTLALMETINDIGAVEFLGVRTLTFAVYSTWLNRGDLAGATQIALFMLVVVVLLVLAERAARRRQRFTTVRDEIHHRTRPELSGWRAAAATLACALPILFGFGIPLFILGRAAIARPRQVYDPALWDATLNTVAVASAAGAATLLAAFLMAYGIRLTSSARLASLVRLASLGYAIPGTVLAIGVLIPLASFDNFVDGYMREWFGISTGLLITGSGFTVVYACFVRFMAMAHGSVESGFAKISTHLDMAARTLGHGPGRTLTRVLVPLMRPAMLTAFMLVFVDAAKELSATILLRPFNFETLATFVYAATSRAHFEQVAVASLMIVIVGIFPVVVLNRALTGNAGSR